MGEVYKARARGPHGFEKVVAIKRILPSLALEPRFVEMFIREARVAATLSHANIVQVFELGRIGEGLYIAMEYIDGGDLRAILRACARRDEKLPLPVALHIGMEVCRGLECAHGSGGRGLVHRDINPANILLSYNGEVKITDFGVAAVPRGQGSSGSVVGKWQSMAPEQARGGEVDARSDVFSTGVLLYEALTGRPPYPGNSAAEILEQIQAENLAPPSATPGVPAQLDQPICKALALRPEARHATAGAFLAELDEAAFAAGVRLEPMATARAVRELLEPEPEPTASRPAAGLERAGGPASWVDGRGEPVDALVRRMVRDGVTVLEEVTRHRCTVEIAAPAAVSPNRPRRWWVSVAVGSALLLATGGWLLQSGLSGAEPSAAADPLSQAMTRVEEVGDAADLAGQPPVPTGPSLRIATEPAGVTATLDGRALGVTPIKVERVEPGIHRLALTKPGYAALDEEIDLRGPESGGLSVHRRLQRRVAHGSVNVFSEPWGNVWVDGRKTDKSTPLRALRLTAGPHRIEVINPVLGQRATADVVVKAGKSRLLRLTLR
jgi:serine/threonine-protein kinase